MVLLLCQIDNQLPDAIAQVILHPTHLRFPQPTIRLFIRKNKTASQSYQLASYDVVEFVMQELDVNLEQQTVMATWIFLQDCVLASPRLFLPATTATTTAGSAGSGGVGGTVTTDDLASTSNSSSGIGSGSGSGGSGDMTSAHSFVTSASTTNMQHYEVISPQPQPQPQTTTRMHSHTQPALHETSSLGRSSMYGNAAIASGTANSVSAASSVGMVEKNPITTINSIQQEMQSDDNKLYISHFKLHPLKINVSFVMTTDAHNSNVKSVSALSKSSLIEAKSSGILTSFSSFMRQIGELLLDLSSNITKAPIFIHATTYDHLLTSEEDLSRILKNFYFHSIVVQVSELFSYMIVRLSVCLFWLAFVCCVVSVAVVDFYCWFCY